MMACADPAQQDQETQFLAALQSAATFQVKGKHLEMRTADDAIAVGFESR